MGISNGLEIGRMDSETMSVWNKGQIKGDAGQMDSDVKTASEIIDQLKANHTINLISPISQEADTIVVIDDDHEPEEGEITNTDDEIIMNETTADFEYEAISSEEEFSLRQKIEALEARNLELEKIASISCYSRENFNSYKTLTIEDGPSHSHTNRKNFIRKIPPSSNHPATNSRIILSALPAHIEDISSDEEPTIDNETDYLLNDSKYVGRAHRVTKKEKRRKKEKRHKHDDRKSERTFKAYSYSSGSDNNTLLRNRDELIMALNMNEQTRRSSSKSTLYDKLSALQKQPNDDCRKLSSLTSTKRKGCKGFGSPSRDPIKRKTEHSDDYKNKRNKSLPADDEDELHSLEEQELRLMALKSAVLKKHEARKKRQAATQQPTARPYSPTDSVIADESGERSIDCIDSDNNNMDISPISSPGGSNQCQPMDMELASSNESSKSPVFCRNTIIFDEQYVDWGTSIAVPVPFNATYIEIDQSTQMNHQFPNIFGQNQMSAGFEPVHEEIIDNAGGGGGGGVGRVNVDSEDELRAQLIEQLRNQNSSNSNSGIETVTMTVVDDEIQTKNNDEISHVDTLEEDCLRSLLLSSKGKKSKANDAQTTSPKIEATVQRISVKPDTESEWGLNDDLPKLTMNLREALKRLKSNQPKVQPIPIVKSKMKTKPDACVTPVPIMETKTTMSNISVVEQPKNTETVNNETIKTVIEESKMEMDVAKRLNVPSKRKPTQVPVKHLKQNVGGMVVTKKSTIVKTTTEAPSTSQTSTPKIVNQPKKETEIVAKPVTKATIEKPILPMDLDALRKSTSSPIITTWKPKPVKRLIISLNPDSSSDETDDNDRENQLPNKTDLNTSTNSNNDDSTNAFQLRLDQFLQSVRKNTDANQDTKKLSAIVVPAAKAAKKSILTISQKQAHPESKVEESKAVRHLPLSSRLEYHRLISRMKLLEKQKEQKSRTSKTTSANHQHQAPQTSSSSSSTSATKLNPIKPKNNFPELTVVLLNDRCTLNDKDTVSIADKQKTLIPSTIKSSALPSTNNNNNSLAKHVLVKNTIENLISEEVKLAAASMLSKEVTETTVTAAQMPQTTLELSSVQKEQPVDNNTMESENPKKLATSSSISIADLANKTPKVQATVLANYEKRYRTHEETYLNDLIKVHRLTSRTNLETRKQQKLEQELNELRKKVQFVEESLKRQNNLMKNLYPAVAMAEKTAISSRTQLHKLETSCNRLGAMVQSTEYKIKCDKEDDIKMKLKQICLEKLKLKQLDPTAIVTISKRIGLLQANAQKAAEKVVANNINQVMVDPGPSTVAAGNNSTNDIENVAVAIVEEKVAIQKIISADTNNVTSTEAPITVENSTKSTEGNEICIADLPIEEIPTKNPKPEHGKKEPAQEECMEEEPAAKELIEAALQMDEGTEIGTQIITSEPNNQPKLPHEIFFSAAVEISGEQINDEDTVYGKYSSPLEHLKCDKENESSATEPSLDSIICPFDLMGRCEDKQCKYRHLFM